MLAWFNPSIAHRQFPQVKRYFWGRVLEGRAKYVPNRVLLRSVRRTLVGVRVQEAAELLAIDIYTRAEKSGAHLC
jgi:hypothetical protein